AEKMQPPNEAVTAEARPAAEVLRRAVAVLEPRVVAAPEDEESRRLLTSAMLNLVSALELQGLHTEAEEMQAKNRRLRVNAALWQLAHKTYLPRRPQFVSEGVASSAFSPRRRKEAAQFVADAERVFRKKPSPDTANALVEACLKAGSVTEFTDAGRSEVVEH